MHLIIDIYSFNHLKQNKKKLLMYLIKQECNEFNYRCRKYIDDKVFLRYGGKFYNH